MMHTFKPGLRGLFATLALAASGWLHAETITLDKIVAVVDDDVVMASELHLRLSSIARKLQASQTELPPLDVLQSQVLEHLIVERLQLQMAGRGRVRVEDAELNQALARIRQGNQLSEAEFAQQLALEGMTPGMLREEIRREMLLNRVQQGQVNRRIRISEQEVDNFLGSTEGKFWTSPDYHLSHLLVAIPSGASADEIAAAEAKAQDLFEKASQGADFKQMAVAHSAGQNALEGGDLGWRKRAQLPSLFADVAPTLKVGDVSAPFRSAAGFHMLKLNEQRGGGERLVEQSKVRHILVKPSAILSDAEARDKLVDIKRQISEGADFAALAKENSEDIGSMLSGGDLGWSMPGQFVPEFEATMNQIAVNEISPPFRSQFGWHILQVQEKRKEDMSEAMIRNQAKTLLRKRRFEEELEIWLREIRDEAYVEIKLPEASNS